MSSTEKSYWLPDIFPEPTEEYQKKQSEKWYLTQNNVERIHPKWHYDNGAYVDDEYLYKNEGWRVLLEKTINFDDSQISIKNPMIDWIVSADDRKVTVTWKIYQIIESSDFQDIDQDLIISKILKPQEEWVYNDDQMTSTKTYNFDIMSEETLLSKKKNILRSIRNEILSEFDWTVVYAIEKNVTILQKVLDYRQQLRDLPQNIDVSTYKLLDIISRKVFPPEPKEPYFNEV